MVIMCLGMISLVILFGSSKLHGSVEWYFSSNLEILYCYFFKYFFLPQSLLFLDSNIRYVRLRDSEPHRMRLCVLLFLSQCFSLHNIFNPVFKLTDLSNSLIISFWCVQFAIKPVQWIFHFKYYVFQLQDFIWFFLIVSISVMRLPICSFIVSIFYLNPLINLFSLFKNIWLLIPTSLSQLGLFLLTAFFLFSNFLLYAGHCRCYFVHSRLLYSFKDCYTLVALQIT